MHWTYEEHANMDRNRLCQGDFLIRTEAFDDVIRDVHPHFIQSKYCGFIVLTQSCDLVRRKDNECKAPYITIAVVRDALETVQSELARLISSRNNQSVCNQTYVSDKLKDRFKQIVASLLNNNLPGYFYFKADNDFQISKDACAFLRVSIALRPQHYDTLLAAKVAQLNQTFQAKLGWMVGNCYSRVGTRDWEGEALRDMIQGYTTNICHWTPDKEIRAIYAHLKKNPEIEINSMDVDKLLRDKEVMPKSRKSLILEALDSAWPVESEVPSRKRFLNKLTSCQEFRRGVAE